MCRTSLKEGRDWFQNFSDAPIIDFVIPLFLAVSAELNPMDYFIGMYLIIIPSWSAQQAFVSECRMRKFYAGLLTTDQSYLLEISKTPVANNSIFFTG
jgi:hypothetical protein